MTDTTFSSQIESSHGVTGPVRMLLRFEGLALLIAALFFYWQNGTSWTMFAILFLVPDLSMLGYLFGARIGAIAYNAAHATIGAATAVVLGYFLNWAGLMAVGLIWAAHIGFDRALGFGLKYPTAFGDTHLGRIGRFGR